MFDYKSQLVQQKCVEYYVKNESQLGRDAVHALNSMIGSVNSQLSGQTYAAIFAQSGILALDFEYEFLNERIGDNDTASQHSLHILFLESRERFVHQRLIPIEGLSPSFWLIS